MRQPHPKSEVGDIPRHQFSGTDVGERSYINNLETFCVRWFNNDRRRTIAEQRMHKHLLDIVCRWLHVQAGQLDANQERSSLVRSYEIARHTQPWDCRVTTHVTNQHSLHRRIQLKVASEKRVNSRGRIPSA